MYLKEDGATRRGDNIHLTAESEDDGYQAEDAGRDEEGSPVSMISCKEGSRDGAGRAPVDRRVEPVVDTMWHNTNQRLAASSSAALTAGKSLPG